MAVSFCCAIVYLRVGRVRRSWGDTRLRVSGHEMLVIQGTQSSNHLSQFRPRVGRPQPWHPRFHSVVSCIGHRVNSSHLTSKEGEWKIGSSLTWITCLHLASTPSKSDGFRASTSKTGYSCSSWILSVSQVEVGYVTHHKYLQMLM